MTLYHGYFTVKQNIRYLLINKAPTLKTKVLVFSTCHVRVRTYPSLLERTSAVAVELPDGGSGVKDEHVVRVQALLPQRHLLDSRNT